MTALDCFSEDTLEPLARSVVGLLSAELPAAGKHGNKGIASDKIALVVYKSRLPAREAAFFGACRDLGLSVRGPFSDGTSPTSSNGGSDKLASTAMATDGTGPALIFSLHLALQ